MADIDKLIKLIDDAVVNFVDGIPGAQQALYKELLLVLKDLEIENGKLLNTVHNIKGLGRLKTKINEVIVNDKYKKQVAQYLEQFNAVTAWQNNYFSSAVKNYSPPKVLEAIKTESVDATVTAMTESGIDANVGEAIRSVLRTAITSGGSYAELTENLRNLIQGTPETAGIMDRYLRTIATDSINTYSATYNEVVASDLGLNWFRYTGSLMETSRPFCIECEKFEYFHRNQIPDLLKGKIYTETVELYKKTGLPEGMKANTNTANFAQLRGGWNCGHQVIWITEGQVPEAIKNKAKTLYAL